MPERKVNKMRRSLISILAVSLAVTLAGCMVGPDYRRPTVDTPQSFRYEEQGAREAVNTTWWQQFQDPVLDGLINEALANNKNVKIAAAAIEQAAGFLTQTRAPLFPQASYNAGGARQRATELGAAGWSSSVPNPQTSFQLIGGATWEVDLWGRIRRLTESAQASLMAALGLAGFFAVLREQAELQAPHDRHALVDVFMDDAHEAIECLSGAIDVAQHVGVETADEINVVAGIEDFFTEFFGGPVVFGHERLVLVA